MIIKGKSKLNGGKIKTFKDHRIAMAFSTLNLISAEKIKLQKGQYLEDLLALKFDWISNKELPAITDSNNNHELTFDDLVNKDVTITEADIRDLKSVENKLKVGMLLQAKTSLNRILKLSRTLDKLYDELVTRIDTDLTNTDTASLMYTADYISKALHDTNQFIVSLINNDKTRESGMLAKEINHFIQYGT